MRTSNIITVKYSRCGSTVTDKVFQYDKGQKLSFSGFDLPESFTVHFANEMFDGQAQVIPPIDGLVEIPEALLETGQPVFAWLYMHLADGCQTVYTITIPVIRRSAPSDIANTPSEASAIDRAIMLMNAAIEQSQSAANRAENAALALDGVVRFDTALALTPAQKAQAQANIGIDELPEEGAPAIVVQPNIDSVTDAAADRPMKVAIEFRPKQTGTGTPSEENLRPFESWNYVGLEHGNGDLAIDYAITLPFPILGGVVTINEEGPIQVQNWWNHDTYTGQTLPGEWMSDRDVYAPGTLPTIGADIVWKRASPINLTGVEMSLAAFGGYNKVTGDGCEATIAQYVADTKKYVDGHDQGNVRYDEEQELTETQKAQAVANMGLADIAPAILALVNRVTELERQLAAYNARKLCESTTPANTNVRGVNFTWTGNYRCVVSGQLQSGSAASDYFAYAENLPTDDIQAGKQYFIAFTSTGSEVLLRVSYWVQGTNGLTQYNENYREDTPFFLSRNAVAFALSLFVPANSGYVSETVNVGVYSAAPSNIYLFNMIKKLQSSSGSGSGTIVAPIITG